MVAGAEGSPCNTVCAHLRQDVEEAVAGLQVHPGVRQQRDPEHSRPALVSPPPALKELCAHTQPTPEHPRGLITG